MVLNLTTKSTKKAQGSQRVWNKKSDPGIAFPYLDFKIIQPILVRAMQHILSWRAQILRKTSHRIRRHQTACFFRKVSPQPTIGRNRPKYADKGCQKASQLTTSAKQRQAARLQIHSIHWPS